MEKKSIIEIHNLKKTLDDKQVLNGVDLTVYEGELLAIIGKSGVGKSVLLRHIIGLLKPDSGSIIIKNVDITHVKQKNINYIRQSFGVLFQGGALFDSLSVHDNIAFPLRERTLMDEKKIEEAVSSALDEVGLSGIEQKYPAELSGGMKKRVALARALITHPSILFFDEPTTGLDPIRINAIHELIKTMHKKNKFTGIIVSHEIPEIFSVADRIAMLDDGKILKVGNPEEIVLSNIPEIRRFIYCCPVKESSFRDPITTLYSRKFLEEYSEILIAGILRKKTSLGVLMCDLDNLKGVNGRYGYDAGDILLKESSTIIKESVRKSDIAIRFGGKEFLVLLHEVNESSLLSVAEKIRVGIEKSRINIDGEEISGTISIGVSRFPKDTEDFWQAIKYANVALYNAKDSGKNRVVKYTQDMWKTSNKEAEE